MNTIKFFQFLAVFLLVTSIVAPILQIWVFECLPVELQKFVEDDLENDSWMETNVAGVSYLVALIAEICGLIGLLLFRKWGLFLYAASWAVLALLSLVYIATPVVEIGVVTFLYDKLILGQGILFGMLFVPAIRQRFGFPR